MSELLAGRYKLVRQIGEGGYGAVWLARDEQLHRDIAIKKLGVGDRSQSESQRERFRREAITTAKIDHPNVVTIYDVGTIPESDELFIVMEMLDGRSLLEQLARHGPLDAARALTRFAEALDGLHAAHDVGVVHKDLKPANLFLHRVGTEREQLKVIDFGIARMDSLSKLTGTGRMAGSPRYLAPEYIMGESVTPAIDVYQTALILVEALTGEACIPRGLEFFDTCQRHILGELRIPEELWASPLGPALERALQRHPDDRFSTAAEFAAVLRDVPPESLPTFDVEDTVQMRALDFPVDVPDSEPTVTAMVEQLREREAASRPLDAPTTRYAAVHPMGKSSAPDLDPERDSLPPPPMHARTLDAAEVRRLRGEQAPVAPSNERRIIAFGAVVIFAFVLIGTYIARNTKGDPVVEPLVPPSTRTCLLQCTQWYDDIDLLGGCQDLCRSIRPPTSPPFPLPQASPQPDAVEAPGAEQVEEPVMEPDATPIAPAEPTR